MTYSYSIVWRETPAGELKVLQCSSLYELQELEANLRNQGKYSIKKYAEI